MSRRIIHPARRLHGALTVPGDKSVSHRAVILGGLATGVTRIERLAPGLDVGSTLRCMQRLGAGIEPGELPGSVLVRGVGDRSLAVPEGPLDCGNSGTTMRLLAGVLGSRKVSVTLTGDDSLCRRPMRRVAEPLRRMGARVTGTDTEAGPDRPPLCIEGAASPRAIHHRSKVASAQVKSCVLLAGLCAEGVTRVSEPARSRDHTERMLRVFGVDVLEEPGGAITLTGPAELEAASLFCPGDISSAAFFLCAAAGLPGSRVVLRDVGVNPTRTGILDVLARMGAEVHQGGVDHWGFEPVADLAITGGAGLLATTISGAEVPRLIDELCVLAVLATRAHGTTEVRDAAELRVKETDRLAQTAALLRTLGAEVTERPDGLSIPGPQRLRAGCIDAAGDHRLAMAAAVAGLFASGPVEIEGADAAAVSYPRFFADLDTLVDG